MTNLVQDVLQNSVQVSPQAILNCETRISRGCSGGIIEHAVEHVSVKGYATESAVPYKKVQGNCDTSFNQKFPRVFFHERPASHFAVEKRIAAAEAGIAVRVHSNNAAFFAYAGGVFSLSSSSCRSLTTDHAVSLEGFTATTWRLRNSWGEAWGEMKDWVGGDEPAPSGCKRRSLLMMGC